MSNHEAAQRSGAPDPTGYGATSEFFLRLYMYSVTS